MPREPRREGRTSVRMGAVSQGVSSSTTVWGGPLSGASRRGGSSTDDRGRFGQHDRGSERSRLNEPKSGTGQVSSRIDCRFLRRTASGSRFVPEDNFVEGNVSVTVYRPDDVVRSPLASAALEKWTEAQPTDDDADEIEGNSVTTSEHSALSSDMGRTTSMLTIERRLQADDRTPSGQHATINDERHLIEQLERMDATRIVTSKVKKTRRDEDQNTGAFERTLSLTESLSEFCPAPPLTLEEHPATQVRQSSTLSAAGLGGAAPLIKSRSLRKNVVRPGEGSIISMLKPMTFAIEGEHPEFFVFRLDELEQRVRVAWSTSVGKGRAVPHRHYVPSNGVITFEKGQNLASFTVEIVDDDGWEPIRDFFVQLDEVVEGRGSIGKLDRTNCGIVDDDVYPSKVDRDEEHPIPAKEQHFQSCMNSDIYLTADEVKDTDLIKGFVYERLGHLWPASGYGIFWSIMRGAYHVSMSLVLVLMIDYIWEDAGSQAQGGGGIADDQRQRQILGVDESVFYAAVCCVYVAGATVLHSYTENWIVTYAKFGLVGKQLRDWIVAQLLWADDGRLGLMRAADYLNAGTSEVEAAGMIYDAVFPAVERLAHFFFNVLLILWLSWMATPVILLLIPITVGVQLSRRHATTLVLDQRQRCERQYVASMSDIIENTHTFRSMPSSTIQDLFAVDTSGFGDAHLQAVQFTVVTKERIELIQGMILAAIFFASALMVNSGTLTKGEAVGIIQAFISGSKDIVELSAIAIRMKFNSEGLRMVSRILNYPTDAHTLAQEVERSETFLKQHMQIDQPGTEGTQEVRGELGLGSILPNMSHKLSQNGARERVQVNGLLSRAAKMEWVHEILVARAGYKCPVRRSLATARAMLGRLQRTPSTEKDNTPLLRVNCRIELGGVLLLRDSAAQSEFPVEDAADDDEAHNDVRDTVMKLIAGINIPPKDDPGVIYRPPFLTYGYVPETPTLLEGSILKNLLLGVEKTGREPGAAEAWELARRLGLPSEFLGAPDSFSVGKGGRNLPLSARQIISICRVLLTDADVVMLHKPSGLLGADEAEVVFGVLKQYADYGGLWGMLDPSVMEQQGRSVSHYLTGNGVRTVLFTMSQRHRDTIPAVTSGVVFCDGEWESTSL